MSGFFIFENTKSNYYCYKIYQTETQVSCRMMSFAFQYFKKRSIFADI